MTKLLSRPRKAAKRGRVRVARCVLWTTYTIDPWGVEGEAGFLVTETDDVNTLVAWVDESWGDHRYAERLAVEIAADPDRLDDPTLAIVAKDQKGVILYDLRQAGRLHSP